MRFLTKQEASRWDAIAGWLLEEGAEALYSFSRRLAPAGEIVEIGSFAGRSTVCLARGARDAAPGKVIAAIDPSFPLEFDSNLRAFGVMENVRKYPCSSLDAAETWDAPVTFLYIDADHRLAHVYADFVVWERFLPADSVVAFDDTAGFHPGPVMVADIAIGSGSFEKIADVGGISFLQKLRPFAPEMAHSPSNRSWLRAKLREIASLAAAFDSKLQLPIRPSESHAEARGRLRQHISTLQDLRLSGYVPREHGVAASTSIVDYLLAVVLMQTGDASGATALLLPLVQARHDSSSAAEQLGGLAALRLGQAYDLSEERGAAVRLFEELSKNCRYPEIAQAADCWTKEAFQFTEEPARVPRRRYALEADLSRYMAI